MKSVWLDSCTFFVGCIELELSWSICSVASPLCPLPLSSLFSLRVLLCGHWQQV